MSKFIVQKFFFRFVKYYTGPAIKKKGVPFFTLNNAFWREFRGLVFHQYLSSCPIHPKYKSQSNDDVITSRKNIDFVEYLKSPEYCIKAKIFSCWKISRIMFRALGRRFKTIDEIESYRGWKVESSYSYKNSSRRTPRPEYLIFLLFFEDKKLKSKSKFDHITKLKKV